MIWTDARKAALPTCLCLGLALVVGAAEAQAGPLQEAAARAEEKAASGDAIGAYTIMREALGDFAANLPLTIGKAAFVDGVPTAYSIYKPRADSVFRSGEPLVTYVEPIGLTWKTTGDGKTQTNFTVDFELADSKGDVLAAQKAFGNFSFVGFVRNQEIFTHLTLDITGAQPGDYVLRYTLNDTGSGRSVNFEQPFTLKP